MIYLWYSGATDVTGRALATTLNINGTREKPELQPGDVLIGWGAKTNRDINIHPDITVYNHPNAIRANRNKLNALDIMVRDNNLVNTIAKYERSENDIIGKITRGVISLPLIGRTKFHQGGKGLWVCLTKTHVKDAIGDGADYFQEYIDVKTEYRLHVAFGKVIYAVKKVPNADINHWIEQRKEKVLDYANKNEWNVDNYTIDKVLEIISKEVIIQDRIVRSNRRGWKFRSVSLNNVKSALKTAAINAIAAIGLDFGAVDCALDTNDNPYIIEVNSGPGLQGTAFDKYVNAFNTKLNELNRRQRAVGAQAVDLRGQIDDQGLNTNILDANINGEAPQVVAANFPPVDEGEEGLIRVIRNVRNDDEARAVIDLLMRRRNE